MLKKMMNKTVRILTIAGAFLVLISVAVALPQDNEVEGNKEVRSPAIDNDDFPSFQDDQPAEFSIGNFISGRVGKLFNDILQLPATLFRFITGVVANQPFAKLREEVRNLNISYPKK